MFEHKPTRHLEAGKTLAPCPVAPVPFPTGGVERFRPREAPLGPSPDRGAQRASPCSHPDDASRSSQPREGAPPPSRWSPPHTPPLAACGSETGERGGVQSLRHHPVSGLPRGSPRAVRSRATGAASRACEGRSTHLGGALGVASYLLARADWPLKEDERRREGSEPSCPHTCHTCQGLRNP